jgi:uncharacterized protein YigE (DUF2233 family)
LHKIIRVPFQKLIASATFVALLTVCDAAMAVKCDVTNFLGKQYTVCRIDVLHEHLQLFLRDDSAKPLKHFDALDAWLHEHGQRLNFAMNAGMYQSDLSPLGLFVNAGKEVSSLNTADGYGNFFLKPNGVFYLSASGANIVETSEYQKNAEQAALATQSGPLLVNRGEIHRKFIANSTSRLIRNGVGIISKTTVVFAISDEPVNFFEFATLFRDNLHCTDALYLDGTVSSLYSVDLNRNDSRANLGPIIGVSQ